MQHEKKNDFNKLTYYYKIPGLAPLNVIGFKGTLHIYSEINMVKYHQQKKQKNVKNNLNQK